MRVNITMVSYNRLEATAKSVENLLQKTRGDYSFTVVDNGSTDGSREYLAEFSARHPQMKFYQLRRNMGVAVAANLGWASTPADYYVKIDNDTLVHNPDWMLTLLGLLERNPELGMAGYLLGDWPYRLDRVTLSGGDDFIESDLCNGGCAMMPKRVHEKVGFWNEDYGLYGFGDPDMAGRIRLAGLKMGYVCESEPSVDGIAPDCNPGLQEYERQKKKSTAAKGVAEKRFVLNQFLFTKGLRPLYVQRKYLPSTSGGEVSFSSNREYLPILALQSQFEDKINYEQQDDNSIAVRFKDGDS